MKTEKIEFLVLETEDSEIDIDDLQIEIINLITDYGYKVVG